MQLRAAIVDDEIKGRLIIRQLCEQYIPDIQIIGEAGNTTEAAILVEMEKPDLLFLDIEMPVQSGIDWLRNLADIPFEVIFVTAFNQYAIDAFRLGAVDYLLKPVGPEELQVAVERVRRNLSLRPAVRPLVQLARQYGQSLNRLTIPALNGFEFIDFQEILFLESASNYTFIHLKGGKKITATRTLGDFEEMLEGFGFFRVHKSHIIRLEAIRKYIKGEGGTVVMEDGTEIDVARRKKEAFLNSLKLR